MKTYLRHSFILMIACAGNLTASAATLTSWTSNDDHTIRAKFIGVGAQSVLIEKDGIVFTVPFSRLAPHSIEQARLLGGMIGQEKNAAPAHTEVVLVNPEHSMPEPRPAVQTVPVKAQVAMLKPTAPIRLAQVQVTTVKPMILAKSVVYRPSLPAITPPRSMEACTLSLAGKTATPTAEVPYTVQRAIEAGNFLQTKPYIWGGGHGSVIDKGYDCSGSVSYVLIQAGLLRSPLTSSGFARYGAPGPGKWISIYAGSGHVFMTVCGLRLDTGGRGGRGESGPRWCMASRGSSSWTVRHPPGM